MEVVLQGAEARMLGLTRVRLKRIPRVLGSPRLLAYVLRALASGLLARALPLGRRRVFRYRWRYGDDNDAMPAAAGSRVARTRRRPLYCESTLWRK